MKFKNILLLSFLMSLNLSAFEPMNPSIATKKASYGGFLQVNILLYHVVKTIIMAIQLLLALNAMTIVASINLKSNL